MHLQNRRGGLLAAFGPMGLYFIAGLMIFGLRAAPLSAEPLSEINTQWLERQEKALQWGRDPFALPIRPAGGDLDSDGEFHLSAIIYREGHGVAIINNKILRQGDTIEGRRVSEILEDRVVLQGMTGEKELRVKKAVLGR